MPNSTSHKITSWPACSRLIVDAMVSGRFLVAQHADNYEDHNKCNDAEYHKHSHSSCL